MSEKPPLVLPYDDYAQSANTLFHFMSKSEYLKFILMKKAIVPRYCIENIEYLGLHAGSTIFKEVAILQKCFCDIPFHKLTDNFELKAAGEKYDSLTNEEKLLLTRNNTHPDYYGKFAIAFSKKWGEDRKLQPVHYLNEKSYYTSEFAKLVNRVLFMENLSDAYADDILARLAYIKPLRGVMQRTIRRAKSDRVKIEFYKNFHDEQEWRYVPEPDVLAAAKMECMIANPNLLLLHTRVSDINESLSAEEYRPLWLKYNYDDIRYIIVPDLHARIEIIDTIMKIPDEQFDENSQALIQKYILISKILVLEEIRKDW